MAEKLLNTDNFDPETETGAGEDKATQLLRFAAFDPLVGHLKDASDFESYDLYPRDLPPRNAAFKVMVLGSSTTQFPRGQWPQFLSELLSKRVGRTLIYNGATSGYHSSIELLKILRDAPGIRPHLILSFSGIADIGFLHARPTTPFLHRNTSSIANFLVGRTKAFRRASFGVPEKIQPHDFWLRNTRLARVVSAELGIPYLCFLEPTLARGHLVPNPAESRLLESPQMTRLLPNTGRPYIEEANLFYDAVQKELREKPELYAHVIDISNVFEGYDSVYRDFRHASQRGNKLIARRILDEIMARAVQLRLRLRKVKPRPATPPATAPVVEEQNLGYRVDLSNAPASSWIVCFSGRRTEADRAAAAHWSPFEFVKSFYDKDLHQLYLRDQDNRWYQDGIVGLGDTIDTAAAGIAQKIQATPARQVVTIGNSMGGYAAILFGILTKADRVIAFAPQTFIDHQMRAAHGDDRWQSDLGAIPQDAMRYPDLLPLIEANPQVKISLYYCAGDKLDRIHAERLRRLPNVSIHTLASDDHNVARALKSLGLLAQVIDREIEGLPIPADLTEQTSIYSASADSVVFSSHIDESEC
ncbi:SGNH/GDSL hydrolase family protein [Xanthobacter agilis]|uniref:Uncharacterized protein n=1 Tax=Xanthobacter agilis TaxID=47492 RepID=A0ABU0LBU1_XANAG|nr:SGNH/GDSL hydrolase family protein [Xanthobacter agilis]MDQ0504612.1 hypothetical protein [Xanthobacter agilis]